MKAASERRMEVNDLIRRGDVDAMNDYFHHARAWERPAITGWVLAHDPLPEDMAVSLLAGRVGRRWDPDMPQSWVEEIAAQDIPVKWRAVLGLIWREFDDSVQDKTLALWHDLFEKMVTEQLDEDVEKGVNDFLVGMLDHRPEEAIESLGEPEEHGYRALFKLSLIPSETTWTDCEALNMAAMLEVVFDDPVMLCKYAVKNEAQGTDSIENWLKHPARAEALTRHRAMDDQRMKRAQEWQDRWIPGGEWKGSPLGDWASGSRNNMDDTPVDREGWTGRFRNLSEEDQDAMATEFLIATRRGRLSRAEQWRLVEEARVRFNPQGERTRPHPLPADPLAAWLHHATGRAGQLMTDPAHLDRVKRLMEDSRAPELLRRYSATQVLEWAEAQPEWVNWKSESGKNLLDLWIQSQTELGRSTMIPARTLHRMAKKMPVLLTNPSGRGGITLDRLDIKPALLAKVKAALLKQNSQENTSLAARRKRAL